MFKEFKYWVTAVGKGHYGFKIIIINDDFKFEGDYVSIYSFSGKYAAVKAIIDCYSKKNLNVALNLYLLIKQQETRFQKMPLDNLLEDSPEIEPYLEKIEKYKMLE